MKKTSKRPVVSECKADVAPPSMAGLIDRDPVEFLVAPYVRSIVAFTHIRMCDPMIVSFLLVDISYI